MKDGFFILKEKFRKGINPQEKVKIEKEPMKLFMENGIEELAKKSMEELDSEKSSKDDIDVRLKWLGLFHRRKHQCMFSNPLLSCVIELGKNHKDLCLVSDLIVKRFCLYS